jgi:hypothetical protein
MQIHVSKSQGVIAIYSKSKRNSTEDRIRVHKHILASLGISSCPIIKASRKQCIEVESAILEAELCDFDEETQTIGRLSFLLYPYIFIDDNCLRYLQRRKRSYSFTYFIGEKSSHFTHKKISPYPHPLL